MSSRQVNTVSAQFVRWPIDNFSGTGSGSFSHSVARSIGKGGHLWSYEFHETRAAKARYSFYVAETVTCLSIP